MMHNDDTENCDWKANKSHDLTSHNWKILRKLMMNWMKAKNFPETMTEQKQKRLNKIWGFPANWISL